MLLNIVILCFCVISAKIGWDLHGLVNALKELHEKEESKS